MSSRGQRLFAEVSRFLAVGGVATIVAFVIFNLLVHGFNTGEHALLPNQPILAYVIANTVGMAVSFTGSRHYTFRDRPSRHADGGISAYVIINVATMALPIACLAFSRDVLGRDDPLSDNIAANVIGLALGLGARFYLFRTYVFRRPIHLTELYSLDYDEGPDNSEDAPLPGGPVGGVSARPTDQSRNGLVPPSAP